MEINSFVIYRDFIDAWRDLESVSFQELFLKLADFALDGNDTHCGDSKIDGLLQMAKANVEAATLRYLRAVENGSKGKDFGYLGGRRRKGETYEEYRERRIRETAPAETPKIPLNIDIDIDDDKEINKETNINLNNNNWSSSAPLSGCQTSEETIKVSKGQLDSFSLSIGSKQPFQGPQIRRNFGDTKFTFDIGDMSASEVESKYVGLINMIAESNLQDNPDLEAEQYLMDKAAYLCSLYDKISMSEARYLVVKDATGCMLQIIEQHEEKVTMKRADEIDEEDTPF